MIFYLVSSPKKPLLKEHYAFKILNIFNTHPSKPSAQPEQVYSWPKTLHIYRLPFKILVQTMEPPVLVEALKLEPVIQMYRQMCYPHLY